MSEPVIRMENIVKTYYLGKPNELEILHGINLTVNKGEFVSIVGESGSGKSTLMNIIGVLDRQTQGDYYLEGQDVNGMSDEVRSAIRNRRIGFVFQNFNLLPRANALKNVMVPLLYGEEHSKNGKEHAMEMLKMVGMEDRADHRPNELSGGQKQRVAIARAMINDPAIILADEPTDRTVWQTVAKSVTIIITKQFCLSVHDADRALVACLRTNSTTVTFFFVYLDHSAYHMNSSCFPLPFSFVLFTGYCSQIQATHPVICALDITRTLY